MLHPETQQTLTVELVCEWLLNGFRVRAGRENTVEACSVWKRFERNGGFRPDSRSKSCVQGHRSGFGELAFCTRKCLRVQSAVALVFRERHRTGTPYRLYLRAATATETLATGLLHQSILQSGRAQWRVAGTTAKRQWRNCGLVTDYRRWKRVFENLNRLIDLI